MNMHCAALLLIDDHPLFRVGVRSMLAQARRAVHVVEAADVPSAVDALKGAARFDLIVYDWHLHSGGGVAGLVTIQAYAPDVPLLVVVAGEEDAIRMAATRLGAVACVSKTTDTHRMSEMCWHWLDAPKRPPGPAHARGQGPAAGPPLTRRQRDVLGLMAQGHTNKQIANSLHLAQTTVRAHVSDVIHVLEAHNRTEAVMVASRFGLLDGGPGLRDAWITGPEANA